MRHTFAVAVLAAAAAACTGNTGTTGTTGTTGSDSPRASAGEEITVSGCVQGGSPAGTYVLQGTAGSDPSPTFRLIPGGQQVDLGDYLNQQVRITGEIANGHSDRMEQDETPETAREQSRGEGDVGRGVASRPNQGSGGGRVQPDTAAQNVAGRFLRVRSIQKVADGCK